MRLRKKYKSRFKDFIYSPEDEGFNYLWTGSRLLPKTLSSLIVGEEVEEEDTESPYATTKLSSKTLTPGNLPLFHSLFSIIFFFFFRSPDHCHGRSKLKI